MTIVQRVQKNKLSVAACLCFFWGSTLFCRPSACMQQLEYGYLWRVRY